MKTVKNKIAIILLATLATLAFLSPKAAHADLIWYEGFNYANGNITNVSNNIWINFSGNGVHDMFVNNGRLEISTTGNAISSRADDDRRPMSSPYTNSVQVLYASYTVICTNLPNGAGSYISGFDNPKTGNGGGFFGRVQAFTNGTTLPKTWRLGATANNSSTQPANGGYPLDLALNTPYQVVEELDPVTLNAVTIWINPLDITQTGNAPTETHYTSVDSIGFATTIPVTDYMFRQASSFGNGFWIVTNLAVATSFAEAATNIWTTNAIAPVIVVNPVGVTNFPGSSFILWTVANGQGLGNLTYQWRTNSVNFDNPNGNTNYLSFIGVPASFGTNLVDVIVTTPFGLSATSAVTKVAIDTTPQPPIFAQQPVATTVYVGQNAILSTTVATPGTATFTWYSNNVPFTGTVNSTAYSSSVQINNTTAANNATYKVAVTNDVVTTGIVSTNAVLTVLPVPAVSIAFLRSLTDPANNYQFTGASIPYQITGTVTTYTNLTTGNTSSYYLQDATAGINIFATFGSTFRPAQGDVVTFIGVLANFSSGLELFADPTNNLPYTGWLNTGANVALPTPLIIPNNITNGIANMNTNIAGRYVQLTNVFFGTNAGTAIASGFYTVTNKSGQPINLWFSAQDLDTTGQTFPIFAYSVTGVMFGSMNPNVLIGGTPNPNFAVAVTKFSDINTSVGVNSAVICAGSSATLTVQTNGGYNASFVWSPGGQTTASITVSPASTTTYAVTVTNADTTTLVGSAIGTVTVNPVPVAQTIKASSASICSNSPTTISVNGSVTGTTYLLQTNASVGVGTVFGSTNGSGIAVAFAAVTPKVSTTYWVVATNSTGCGLTVGSTNITVNPLPILAISPASPSICSNSSVLLTASGATTYGWSPATGLSATTGASVTASPTTNTTYTLTGTNASGCTSTTTVIVTVNPLPLVAVSPASATISSNSSVLLTASGATTYGWSPATGLSATTGTSVTASPATTTTYTLTGTNASGCNSTKQVTVTVVPVLPVTITSIAGASIGYTGGSGLRFILLSSGDLTTPASIWVRLFTNANSPGSFTIPVVGSSNQLFYRVKSE